MTRASTLDLISLWMDTPERRLDFAVTLKLRGPISSAALLSGARHARMRYPRANALLAGERWIPSNVSAESLLQITDDARAIDEFLRVPLDPTREPPIRQLALFGSDHVQLVTRSHHAAADLMSVLLFLRTQLAPDSAPPKEIAVRTHPQPVRKSRFAHSGPSTRLWTRRTVPSGERKVRRFDTDARVREAIARNAGYTYNDLLGAAVLRAVRRFQEAHGADTEHLSLWFPMNVRVDPWDGFGNGSSRIRIYERHLSDGTPIERARAFREQVSWSKEHGEWAVPERHPLLSLPAFLRRPVLRAYLCRPWVDMGTMLFSHIERLSPDGDLSKHVDAIEIVSPIDRRHAAGIAAVTLGDRTQLSLTWDPALLDDQDADELIALHQEEIERACRELERCAA